jgi:hypothetical protein
VGHAGFHTISSSQKRVSVFAGVDPMADVFSLDRYSIAHAAKVERRDGLFIVTDSRQWAHAVEFTPSVDVSAGLPKNDVWTFVTSSCLS